MGGERPAGAHPDGARRRLAQRRRGRRGRLLGGRAPGCARLTLMRAPCSCFPSSSLVTACGGGGSDSGDGGAKAAYVDEGRGHLRQGQRRAEGRGDADVGRRDPGLRPPRGDHRQRRQRRARRARAAGGRRRRARREVPRAAARAGAGVGMAYATKVEATAAKKDTPRCWPCWGRRRWTRRPTWISCAATGSSVRGGRRHCGRDGRLTRPRGSVAGRLGLVPAVLARCNERRVP